MKLLDLQTEQTMSSREISELTGKRHDHVLRDVDNLNNNYNRMGLPKVGEGYYTHPNTGNQQHREYLLTRIQTFDLMTGYNVELRIKVNRRWEELEKQSTFQLPQSYSEALRLAADQAEKIEEQNRLIEEQKPKALFADAVTGSSTTILMRDLAKLIRQNGVSIGEVRLYDWMVKNNYLIRKQRWSNKKQRYENDYMPTQRASDLKVFFVTEQVITVGERSFIKHTVKITGKGQKYFINKFIKERGAA